MNPVRDIAPRLFLWMIGYGSQVFSSYNYYFWIPLIGPIIGGIIAVYIYDFNKNYLYKTD